MRRISDPEFHNVGVFTVHRYANACAGGFLGTIS